MKVIMWLLYWFFAIFVVLLLCILQIEDVAAHNAKYDKLRRRARFR
ncbi:hypothetical protein KOR42_23070 [Thalassoglobus neptunius]|uniref:Uncharacterized protein n=1 Tax=Thalassoglobus neptunius TaxID=1938619 RepID=A0A5C5X7J4_9PLAN|nr:hypothetical protein [Thalassoglobus neptunius]TWT58920.1 hypothetical protein KOR42_23070 [Thalassoglobus neptunius]